MELQKIWTTGLPLERLYVLVLTQIVYNKILAIEDMDRLYKQIETRNV